MNPNHPLTAHRMARFLRLIEEKDRAQADLAELTATCARGARMMVALLVELEKVHIVGWESRTGLGPQTPIVRIGPGVNLERPAPIDGNKRSTMSRARIRADPELHERSLKVRRLTRGKKKQHPLVSCFFAKSA